MRREADAATLRDCNAARERQIAELRRGVEPGVTATAAPSGVVLRRATHSEIHLFHCLPDHLRLE